MKTILVDAVNTFFLKDHGIFWEMQRILDSFPNSKVICTNATNEDMASLWIQNMPYEVFSLQHDSEKTDPKYYSILLKNLTLKPPDVIYFEDN